MKKTWLIMASFVVLALFVSCAPPIITGAGETPETGSLTLPPDVIGDITRSYSEPFEYREPSSGSSFLTIDLYEAETAVGKKSLQSVDFNEMSVIVSITNSRGNEVYKGRVQADSTLSAVLQLPAAPEDMTLTVRAEGFAERREIIRDMRRFVRVERRMGLLRSMSFAAKTISGNDRDGDMVPDAEDAFPDDPLRAFIVRVPAEQNLNLAFEGRIPPYTGGRR